MNSAIDYLGVASLLAMRAQATNRALSRTRVEFVDEFQQRYGWAVDSQQVEKALRQLEAWKYLSITTDRYAGESLQFTKLSTDTALFENLPEYVVDIYAKARQGGISWMKDVFANQEFWNDLHEDTISLAADGEGSTDLQNELLEFVVPASDRIVSTSHNRQEVDLLSADLKGISEEIRENNEASIELGEEKELIEGEIRAAEVLVSQSSFRLERLYALILPALRFLSEKFASGAIGEMAKRIISLLFGLGS